MNILIFDDDISTVQMLRSSINWGKLGIGLIYQAYSINQAKEIFVQGVSIDIMLCDIEAPGGTGIDLLRWVREKAFNTENIFLTNHEEFCYAKEAIQLGSVDYILKLSPLSVIEEAILKAINKVKLKNILVKYKYYEEYWSDNHCLITEQFWKEVLQRNTLFDRNELEAIVRKRKVDVDLTEEYLIILISLTKAHDINEKLDDSSMQFIIKKIALQIILNGNDEGGDIIYIEKGIKKYFSLVLKKTHVEKISIKILKKNCMDFISFCNANLDCSINCYLGSYVHCEEVGALESKLENIDLNNVCSVNNVFELYECVNKKKGKPGMPDTVKWADMLKRDHKSSLFISVKNYIFETSKAFELDAEFMDAFKQDFTQMLFFVLEQEHIQAHKLFSDEKFKLLTTKAANSIYDMLKWVDYSISKASDCINEIGKMKSVIDEVKDYIELNFDKNISRNDIASKFYLNPDYLSRIFNKETGLSIPEYQAKLRINKAVLLLQSGMSISETAASVGYDNYSYFSTVYKKIEGVTPVEFRKRCKK